MRFANSTPSNENFTKALPLSIMVLISLDCLPIVNISPFVLKNAHSAAADTLATYEVLKSMLDKYEKTEFTDKEGNTTIPIVNDMDALGKFSRRSNNVDLIGRFVYNSDKVEVFNFGKHRRDFTYIDDIVEGIIRVIDSPAQPNINWDSESPDAGSSKAPWRVYNIGNSSPVELMDYIKALENALGIEAEKNFLPLQDGDVPDTYANVEDLIKEFKYKPSIPVKTGVTNFVNWYREHYGI